ncbi:MAG TPA: DUF6789 family protein [Kofleriaceae bacterium]|nr:DUF6789 family protein [Kofleriaceae bacterium]
MNRNSPSQRLVRGAVAGAVATAPMTAVMFAAQKLGFMGRQPPAKITDAALDQLEVDGSRLQRDLLAAAAHVGFGAAAGALFGLLRRRRTRGARAAAEGATFGTAVWVTSYAGWVPAFGIMPPPSRDRAGRPSAMLVAHWVFGTALGLVLGRLRRPRR